MVEQNHQQQIAPQLYVGVGASTDGLESFAQFLKTLDDSADFTIVFIPRSGLDSDSDWKTCLEQHTSLPIVELNESTSLAADTVYVYTGDALLEILDGQARMRPALPEHHSVHVIDHFLQSLASDQGSRAVGVLLPGDGSDGSLGIQAISDHGGLTFAQPPKSKRPGKSPRKTEQANHIDHVLPPEEMARELIQYRQHLQNLEQEDSVIPWQDQIENVIPQITDILNKATSHNFQHYKISTLSRRIRRRMQVLKLRSADEYVNYLMEHKDEPGILFGELLIGVTAFFRDPDAFDALSEQVLRQLFANRDPHEKVRIWVAGCANGAEAYTLAMLCCEVIDTLDNPPEFLIFATDIDDRALQVARSGTYPLGIEEQISPARLKRFFVKRGKQYQAKKEIREQILFSKHNLISDSPFSRLDLISCRNLLIYLGPHLQSKLIPLFHYSLSSSGYLFLGPSENISAHSEFFNPLDQKHRISQRKETAVGSSSSIHQSNSNLNSLNSNDNQPNKDMDLSKLRQRILLDEFAPKSCVIDESGQILNYAADMQKYLSLSGGDFQNNIVKMAARGLRIGLRTAIAEAKKTRRKVQNDRLSIRDQNSTQRVMITVQPMPRVGADDGLFMVVFQDIGLPFQRDENDELQTNSPQDADLIIAQLESELESTRESLEKSMQEMEVTNEELKSSNEELLSMNEELQSANEELEASKEEISNGLEKISIVNTDLENLLRSTQIATVFLDDNRLIRSFTPAITEIYSLLDSDVGRPLEQFVPQVEEMPPLPDLETIREEGLVEDTVSGNAGQYYIRRVLPYQSQQGEHQGIVVTFVNVTELQNSQDLFELLVDASAQIVWITDAEGRVIEDSPSWRAFTGQSAEDWLDQKWIEIIHEKDREATRKAWQAAIDSHEPYLVDYRLRHHSGKWRWVHTRAVPHRGHDGEIIRWVGMNTDITEQKRAERKLIESQQQLSLGVALVKLGLGRVDYQKDQITLSAEAAEIYGLGDTEMTISRETFHSTFHPEDRPAVEAQVQECYDQSHIAHCDLDYRIIYPSGEIRWVSARKQIYFDSPLLSASPSYAILAAQDITDRKRSELNLAFLANLQTQMIPMTSVSDLMEFATKETAEYLNLSRCLIVEFDANAERADIVYESHAPELQSIVGTHSVRDFHSDAERTAIREGRQIFLSDTQHEGQPTEIAEKFQAIGVGAFCNSAFITERGVKFAVSALKPAAYPWRDDERTLLQEITNRLCLRIESARAEEALRKSESHFRDLADNMSQFAWMADEKGFIYWYNKRWFEYTGTTLEEMQGWGWKKVHHPDHVDRVVEHIQHSWDTGEIWEDTFPLRSKEGEYRWFLSRATPIRNEEGKILRWFGTNTDITERQKSEEAIKLSEERLRNAAEAAGFGMLYVDLVNETVAYSPELKQMLQLPDDSDQDIHPDDVPKWIHPEDRESYIRHLKNNLVLTTEITSSLDYRVTCPNTETRWIRLHVKPVFTGIGNEKQITQIIGTILDITEQRQFEQSLKEAREMAEAANEAKSAFLANMSHEIRTPMTAILGYADLISALIHNEEAAGHLRTIRRNGDFLLEIINDILDLSKIEAGKLDIIRERFSPSRLVEDVRSIMEVRATENQLRLDVIYEGKVPAEIETDPKRLKQILINLVGNAIKFTKDGSVKVIVSCENQKLEFKIIDSGIGMSHRQMKRLFQPFSQGDHTVNREFGGTGLGLAISQRLAAMLGGDIRVQSEVGQGSTFTATIDTGDIQGVAMIQPSQVVEPDTPEATAEDFTLDSEILVVDDRRDIRHLSKHFLTKAGANVTEAVDGEEAVKIVTEAMQNDFTIDLILLDMQMPKLDGYETARQLRKLGYTKPIIALTADAMQGDMTRCIECGCNDYLSKPIDKLLMLKKIDQYLKRDS